MFAFLTPSFFIPFIFVVVGFFFTIICVIFGYSLGSVGRQKNKDHSNQKVNRLRSNYGRQNNGTPKTSMSYAPEPTIMLA